MCMSIQLLRFCSYLNTMASQIVVGYFFDSSEDVDVEAECSLCCSFVGDYSVEYCQCSDSEDDPLVECLTCGSLFELDTYCPGC
jgi:hypothetical protein